MLRWATTVRVKGGQRLLSQNPLAGVKRPREKNPKRPITTWDRYQITRAKVDELANRPLRDISHLTPSKQRRAEQRHEMSCRKWIRLDLALTLAQACGRRIGSIRKLAWEDINFLSSSILWRAENDKKGTAWIVPAPASLMAELKAFRLRLGGAFGGLVFPGHRNPSMPISKDAFSHWLRDAEERAGLPKLDGSLWHAYRRAWATARKDHSPKDVPYAGGWKDIPTLMSYHQPDDATLLEVMSQPKRITERVSNG